ncbi:hypothetical protein [Streptomyces sp. NPDC046374]|uniref:hypothetical protein n=1 Tax=unclassified Streptomyces TaxID=2593676 RepID=UPI0033DDAC9F
MTPVLALGAGAVAAAGCVWYVPALVDLRAGADRPASRRLAAAACVTGWATAALTAPLILLGLPAPLLLAVVVAGATASGTVRASAAVRRGREERETAACWAALGAAPPRSSTRRASRAPGPNGPDAAGPSGPPPGPDGGGGAVRN